MDKVIKIWKCPVCGCETARIVRRGRVGGGIADIGDFMDFPPTFGGWIEHPRRHTYPYCKEHFEKAKRSMKVN